MSSMRCTDTDQLVRLSCDTRNSDSFLVKLFYPFPPATPRLRWRAGEWARLGGQKGAWHSGPSHPWQQRELCV